MKYLTIFETHADYEVAKDELLMLNVSLCKHEDEIHFKPFDPYNGHNYVEIGGLKWATMNVGANTVTDYGLYFQWGDTSGYTASQVGSGDGQKYFAWADYKYCNGTSSVMTKYNSSDGKTILDLTDDAARAHMGGLWKMPTEAEFQVLIGATTNVWVTNYEGSGINGRLFTDNTDSSKVLFFPAVGYCYEGRVLKVGSYGRYWSSSLYNYGVNNGMRLYLDSGSCGTSYLNRYGGSAVRGVVV